jgi:hypothetical protein
MARFYATFDHTIVSALEAQTTGNFYDPRFIGANSSLGTAHQIIISGARADLSAAMLAQLDANNHNGSSGVVFPSDGIAFTGGNLTWSNAFTTGSAVWQSDPRVRPNTRNILISNGDPNLLASSPADPGSINQGYYYSASAALMNALNDIRETGSLSTGYGPYGRLGTNPSRTLFSIWNSHDLSYIAWDDFTPGQVQSFTAAPRANGAGVFTIDFNAGSVTNGLMVESGVDDVSIRFNWTKQYLADLAGDSILNASATPAGGSAYTLSSYNPGQGVLQYDWNLGNASALSSATAPGKELTLNSADVRFKDAVIPAHTGIEASISSNVIATVLRVQQKSIRFVSSPTTLNHYCTNTVTAGTYYSNFIQDQYTLAVGAYRVFGSKTSGASLGAGYYVGGDVPSPVGSGNSFNWWSTDGGDLNNSGSFTCP